MLNLYAGILTTRLFLCKSISYFGMNKYNQSWCNDVKSVRYIWKYNLQLYSGLAFPTCPPKDCLKERWPEKRSFL